MGIAASALLVTGAVAQTAPAQDTSYFDGFHVGAGVENRNTSVKSGIGGLDGRISADTNAPVASLSAGYDKVVDGQWLVGGEVAEGMGGRTIHTTGTNGTYSVKAGNDTVVSARAGYLVSPKTVLFGRVGYQWQDASKSATLTDGTQTNVDKDSHGALVGVGVEQAVDSHFGIRGELQSANLDHGLRDDTIKASAHYKF